MWYICVCTMSRYVAPANLELNSLYRQGHLHMQRSTCLFLLRAGIGVLHEDAQQTKSKAERFFFFCLLDLGLLYSFFFSSFQSDQGKKVD